MGNSEKTMDIALLMKSLLLFFLIFDYKERIQYKVLKNIKKHKPIQQHNSATSQAPMPALSKPLVLMIFPFEIIIKFLNKIIRKKEI